MKKKLLSSRFIAEKKRSTDSFRIMKIITFLLLSYALQKVANETTTQHTGIELKAELENNDLAMKKNPSSTLQRIVQQPGRKITGIVLDETGEPVAGANVTEKGNRTSGTITDIEGKFSLWVSAGSSIMISYIGYLPQEIAIEERSDFTIQLVDDTQELDEVLIVGYCTQQTVNLTGSIAT